MEILAVIFPLFILWLIASPALMKAKDNRQNKRMKVTPIIRPRVIGYTGVDLAGYHDVNGKWIEPCPEYTIIETENRTILTVDTREAKKKGLL